jgi:ribosomal protein S11
MITLNTTTFNLNTFLKTIFIKKQYLKGLKKQFLLINNIKQTNYKSLNKELIKKTAFKRAHLVRYIIDISFSRSNTFLQVSDSSGKLKFFSSAGYFNVKGRKSKKSRFNVFKHFYSILTAKLKFLRNKPIALHLKNVSYQKSWVIRKLKTKFFIKIIKIFNLFPFNGCRRKKIRRKKFKKRIKRTRTKKWLSG